MNEQDLEQYSIDNKEIETEGSTGQPYSLSPRRKSVDEDAGGGEPPGQRLPAKNNQISEDIDDQGESGDPVLRGLIEDINGAYSKFIKGVDEVRRILQSTASGTEEERYALEQVRELLAKVVRFNSLVKDRITEGDLSGPIKALLNEELIAQKVTPEVQKLVENGAITEEQAKTYISILKTLLSGGLQIKNEDSIEEQNTKRQQLDELNELIRKCPRIGKISEWVSSNTEVPGDQYYNEIFNLLFKEKTRRQILQLQELIKASLNPELQAHIQQITEEVIGKNSLDLKKIEIINFVIKLGGLERFHIIEKIFESDSLLGKEVFNEVKQIILDRLIYEGLKEAPFILHRTIKNILTLGGLEKLPSILEQIGNPQRSSM